MGEQVSRIAALLEEAMKADPALRSAKKSQQSAEAGEGLQVDGRVDLLAPDESDRLKGISQ